MPGGKRNPLSMSNVLQSLGGAIGQSKLTVKERKEALTQKLEDMGFDVPYVDLEIKFIGARDLPKMDVVGFADPYIIAKIDDQVSFVSAVISNTLNPVWNEVWRVNNVPKTADITIEVLDKDEGTVTDDYVGSVTTGIFDGTKELEIQGPKLKLRRDRGTLWINIQSTKAADPKPSAHPYLFVGPIRFSRHYSPTVGRFTSTPDDDTTRLYSTWKLFLPNVPLFFDDIHQPWNKKYRAAQAIFEGPRSFAVRSGIQAGHRMLYARTAKNGFGTIESKGDFLHLLHGGPSKPPLPADAVKHQFSDTEPPPTLPSDATAGSVSSPISYNPPAEAGYNPSYPPYPTSTSVPVLQAEPWLGAPVGQFPVPTIPSSYPPASFAYQPEYTLPPLVPPHASDSGALTPGPPLPSQARDPTLPPSPTATSAPPPSCPNTTNPSSNAHRIKPAVYTYIISSDDNSFRFSETGAAFFVDFASKHALHSNCAQTVIYSGEFHPRPALPNGWASFDDSIPDSEVDWEIVIDNNSGTYAPDKDMLPTLQAWLESCLFGIKVVAMDYHEKALEESREGCREYALRCRGVKKEELQPHLLVPGEEPLIERATSSTGTATMTGQDSNTNRGYYSDVERPQTPDTLNEAGKPRSWGHERGKRSWDRIFKSKSQF